MQATRTVPALHPPGNRPTVQPVGQQHGHRARGQRLPGERAGASGPAGRAAFEEWATRRRREFEQRKKNQ